MYGLTPEELQAWQSGIPIIRAADEPIPKRRCGGCGKFLSKQPNESYVHMGAGVYHMKEKCLTRGVKKMRETNKNWDWVR